MSEWFEKLTFGRLLDRAAERFGERAALVFEERSWTFAELRAEVDRTAAALDRAGVRPGELVALWMVNRPEWIFIEFAVAKLGAVLLPINTALRTQDCAFILQHSQSATLILAERSGPVSYLDMVNEMAPDLAPGSPGELHLAGFPNLRRVIVLSDAPPASGCLDFGAVVDAVPAGAAPPATAVDPDGLAIVMYTSGTTGTPKGVMHSHHAIRNVTDEANRLNVRETDVTLMFLPLFHAYGLYEGPLLSLVSGATCVLLDRFDAGTALAALVRHRATLCFGFSAHFADLLSHPDLPVTDRSSLRAGIMAVGPRSMEALAHRVQRELGGKIVSGYGMTEIGVGATLGYLDEDAAHSAETSGYPLSGYEVRIVDPLSGEACPRGTAGEVQVRGYQVMLGYLRDPARTAETVDAEGWLHTGDMGAIATDGYVRILGRFKDMLRVGGENVDPAEVEALFNAHPAVAGSVVIGVPDPRLDEVPCLCVELRPGSELDDALREELLALASGRLAAFKRPRYVVAVERFQMTASGKIARSEVQAAAAASLGLELLPAGVPE